MAVGGLPWAGIGRCGVVAETFAATVVLDRGTGTARGCSERCVLDLRCCSNRRGQCGECCASGPGKSRYKFFSGYQQRRLLTLGSSHATTHVELFAVFGKSVVDVTLAAWGCRAQMVKLVSKDVCFLISAVATVNTTWANLTIRSHPLATEWLQFVSQSFAPRTRQLLVGQTLKRILHVKFQ